MSAELAVIVFNQWKWPQIVSGSENKNIIAVAKKKQKKNEEVVVTAAQRLSRENKNLMYF